MVYMVYMYMRPQECGDEVSSRRSFHRRGAAIDAENAITSHASILAYNQNLYFAIYRNYCIKFFLQIARDCRRLFRHFHSTGIAAPYANVRLKNDIHLDAITLCTC